MVSVKEQPFDPQLEILEEEKSTSPKGLNVSSLLGALLRKAWLIVGITSVTTCAGVVWSSLDPPTYQGNFFLLVEPITSAGKLTNPSTLARTGGVPNDDLFELDYPTNLAFLRSPGMTKRIAEEVHDKALTRGVSAIWQDLRENLEIERLGDTRTTATKIFVVNYKGEDPQEVKAVLDTAAQTFLQYSAEDRETSIKAGIKFIDEQLPELQQRLEKYKLELQELRQRYDLVDPQQTNQQILSRIEGLDQQILASESQLQSQQNLATLLQQQLNLTPDQALAAASLSQDPTRTSLLSQLQEIESQIALNSATFTANSYQIQDLQDKRQNLLKLLQQKTDEILTNYSTYIPSDSPALDFQDPTRLGLINQLVEARNQISILETQRQSLLEAKRTLERQVKQFPPLTTEYGEIERQTELTKQILDRLLTQRETLKVEASQELPWQLISPPQIPLDAEGKPISYPPNRKKKILAGFMGGLLLSMGLALLLEKYQDRFYTVKDLDNKLPFPVIGKIPLDDRSPLSPNLLLNTTSADQKAEISKAEFSHLPLPVADSKFLRAFESLYLQLCFLSQDRKVRSLVVSSVEEEDGQSTIALYLAKTVAAANKRVLLVDLNWHNPQLHDWLDLSNQKGLVNLLLNPLEMKTVIQSLPQIPNLDVLSAGELSGDSWVRLWSPQMETLSEKFQDQYDLVIYDAPHFFETTDINFLIDQTDGVLMVVKLNKTSQKQVKKAVEQIQNLDLPALGVVVNNVPLSKL